LEIDSIKRGIQFAANKALLAIEGVADGEGGWVCWIKLARVQPKIARLNTGQ